MELIDMTGVRTTANIAQTTLNRGVNLLRGEDESEEGGGGGGGGRDNIENKKQHAHVSSSSPPPKRAVLLTAFLACLGFVFLALNLIIAFGREVVKNEEIWQFIKEAKCGTTTTTTFPNE